MDQRSPCKNEIQVGRLIYLHFRRDPRFVSAIVAQPPIAQPNFVMTDLSVRTQPAWLPPITFAA